MPFGDKASNAHPTAQTPTRRGGFGSARNATTSSPPPEPQHHGGGGFWSHIPGSKIVSQGTKDIYHAALGTPAGVYYLGKAASHDAARLEAKAGITHSHYAERQARSKSQLLPVAKAYYHQLGTEIHHPLRHPGNTLLDAIAVASLGAGTASRAAELGRLARLGELDAGAAARAIRHGPPPGSRTFRVGDLEVHAPASRSALTRTTQRMLDRRRQAAADANPTGRAAVGVQKRVARVLNEQGRHEDALARAPAEELIAVGKRLKPDQQWALRIQAEETPISDRLDMLARQMRDATGSTRKRLQRRYQLTQQARALMDETSGTPHVADPRLQNVYEKMQQVSGGREQLIENLGLMTEPEMHAAKTLAMRAAAGSDYVKPTPGRLGVASPALVRQRSLVDRLQQMHDRAHAKASAAAQEEAAASGGRLTAIGHRVVGQGRDRIIPGYHGEKPGAPKDVTVGEAQDRLAALEKQHKKALDKMAAALRGPIDESEARAISQQRQRFKKQQSGKDKLGRWSGASSAKAQRTGTPGELRRAEMEKIVEDQIRKNPNSPVAKAWRARTDEIDRLVEALNRMPGEAKATPRELGEAMGLREPAKVIDRPERVVPGTGKAMQAHGAARSERLGAALSVAKDRLQSMEAAAARKIEPTGLIGNEHLNASPQSVKVPDFEQGVGGRGRVGGLAGGGALGEPRSPVIRGYTGAAKRAGAEPLNTTRAVAESNLAITRFNRLITLRDKLRRAARPTPEGMKHPVAIRLENAETKLPGDVKKFIENPTEFAPDRQLSMMERMRNQVLLADEHAADFEQLAAQGKVGWVERRLLGDLGQNIAPLSSPVGKVPMAVVDGINNAQRAAILYLKPAYAIPNLLGNAALTLIHEGFAAPANIARASRLSWTLGPGLTARIDTLVGEGVASALASDMGPLSRATQAGAHIWSRGVDRPFRRAAFIHEARVAGYRTPAEMGRLLTDPAHHHELMDVTTRANRALIDYGRLSTRERQVVRRVIFFYPWVKGSTMYAGHFLAEHQIKAAVLAHMGEYGHERAQRELGPTPSYLEGSFKVGGRLVNPTSAAIFQTPAQVAATAASFVPGGPHMRAALPSQFLTPAEELAMAEITGSNPQTGHTYRKGESAAYDTLIKGLPQYQLAQSLGAVGGKKSKLYKTSPRSGVGKFFLGGLYPQRYDPAYLRQLAGKERSGR